MTSSIVASRYSKALFELGSSKEQRLEYLNTLKQLASFLNKENKIMNFFISPQIAFEQKKTVLEKTLAGFFDENFLSFFSFLLEKGRFSCLPEIIKKYEEKVKEESGIVDGHLVTATPIESKLLNELKTKLQEIYKKQIILTEETDPQLIGGGILYLGNQLLDFSIKGKLERLKDNLLETHIIHERRSDAIKT